MPRVENNSLAPLDLDRVLNAAHNFAADDREKTALLVGADGGVQRGKPTRELPGRWTHFKAAFVGVPLLGKLSSVREAAHLLQAVQFRSDFRLAVERRFGSEVANTYVPATAPNGKKLTLSPKRIIKVMGAARLALDMIKRQNMASIRTGDANEPPPLHQDAAGRYACMLGIAKHADFFRKRLDYAEPQNLHDSAEAALRGMCRQPGPANVPLRFEALPPAFEKVLTSYEQQMEYASMEARQQIAAQCLVAIDNLATIAAHDAGAAGSSSHAAAPVNQRDAAIVSLLCAHAAGPNGRFSPEVAGQAWTTLRDTREKLHAELPELAEEVLSDVLREVTAGKTSISPPSLLQMARERLIVNEMKRLFDPTDAESTLWNAVMLATNDHPAAIDAPMTALIGTLAKEMILDIEFRAPVLHEHFDCEDHLPTIIAKTREKLIENTVAAAVGHLDALRQIENSTTLTPSQKEVFRKYAEGSDGQPPRRLDPVQVEQMIAIAEPMAQRAGGERDPAILFDNMVKSQDSFQSGVRQILLHAETMWISRSLDGTDSEQRLVEFAVRLLIARFKDDPPPALMYANRPGTPRGDNADETRKKVDTSIRQFMHACNQSPSMQVAKLAMLLGDMLRVFKSPLLEADGGITGPRPSLNQVPPELLVRTLAHPSGRADEGGSLDQRGVLADSPNASIVSRNFDPTVVANPERHQVSLERARGDGGDRMPAALNRALAGADVVVAGQRLTQDPAQGSAPAVAAFNEFLDSVPAEVAPAIAACISSNALRDFVGDVNAAAFDPPVATTNPRGSHEIWRDPDGSWLVRSTHVSSPLAQAGKPIHTDGVVLYTLTHRIVPPNAGGDPQIELSDSNVVFAF